MHAALLTRINSQTRPVDVATRDLDDQTANAFIDLDGAGLISIGAEFDGHTEIQGTPAGRRVAAAATPATVVSDDQPDTLNSGDRALWAWMLNHGGVITPFGSYPEATPLVWHLLACGVDVDRSRTPRDGTWTVFEDTDADPGTRTGVTATATCRCGLVTGLALNGEAANVTTLLNEMLVLR